MFSIDLQKIDLSNFEIEGKILDIGGGGEGIISLLGGDRVTAIDPNREELEEAPGDGLKIVMSAQDLKFPDNTFDTVTSFFTLMYIPGELRQKVFHEVYRVLKKDGKFLIWDVKIPARTNSQEQVFAVPLEINMGDRLIKTGYGVGWKNKKQDPEFFLRIAGEAGFAPLISETKGEVFFLEFGKK